jgi:5'-nucleotidase
MVKYFANNSPLTPDYRQRAVGVQLAIPATGFAAGQTVTVKLSSLLFSKNEPKDATITATFNGQSVGSFTVDPAIVDTTDEVGRATVSFVVPESAAPFFGAPAVRNLVITGATTATTVTVPIRVAALHPPAVCTTTVTGQHNGTMSFTTGVLCVDGATIAGPLTVGAGAILYARDFTLNGGLKVAGAAEIDLFGGTVNGGFSSTGAGTSFRVRGVTVNGGMTLNNTGTATIPVLADNRINGGLSCTGNAVPPTDNGQPNKVNGSKSGQCARM